ncbi:proline racemase family protein [Mesorhizobium sp. YC-39]|uniref:proline racemase family protein n=1 Tax=unclassified Mesorhizobium TaxID=325217 RepID=UPI0021E9331B|nr:MULTISPECIES: proline racemase family protein [unclassified Mesorhizobium]MCV3205256.1 proline racemase family protein [Mesorhizobium sp. YC-2]MCV3228345.1 proline racemase family protein [Mesorhizobium sp. YC-39]
MNLDRVITVVGAHAEGEVGRVITGGVLPPRGATMFERMENLERDSAWLRNMLLFDPRGSVNAAVNLITPPIRADADIGMIVMESDYFVPMSGSNLICTVTVALEAGMIPMRGAKTIVRVDTPAGLVEVEADCSGGKCRRITFRNIPSFVMHRDRMVEVPGIGSLRVGVAYGGMIYCIVDAEDVGVTLARDEARDLIELGERIKAAAAEQLPSIHPENPSINTINQTEFAGPLRIIDGVKTSKNAVVVSPGRLDRCPCGTGTSARMALLHARGDLAVGEKFRHTSILDTVFDCCIVETAVAGNVPAVVTEVSGRAWLTGVSHYGVDPEDPFPEGYRLSDTWFR